jgi:hypothetical protein
MKSDDSVKEIQIEISSGRETVIEYEAGGEPVVSQGDG